MEEKGSSKSNLKSEVILMECILEDVCGSSAKDSEWACNKPHEERVRLCICYVMIMSQFKGRVFREIEFQQSLPNKKREGGDLDYE